jgi:hypothetical protein
LAVLLVVVYLRSADSAVVAALSALALAVVLLVAVRWWRWRGGRGRAGWPLLVACRWPAAGARCRGGGRWPDRWPDAACRISKALLVTALQHGATPQDYTLRSNRWDAVRIILGRIPFSNPASLSGFCVNFTLTH